MVTGNVVGGIADVASSITPSILNNLSGMIVVFKALGIVAVIYMSYLIYIGITNFSRRKKLQNIENKVNSMSEKLDMIIKKLDISQKDKPNNKDKK